MSLSNSEPLLPPNMNTCIASHLTCLRMLCTRDLPADQTRALRAAALFEGLAYVGCLGMCTPEALDAACSN